MKSSNVIRVGPAKRWLEAKRKGRQPMKLSLDAENVWMLNAMIRQPDQFPLSSVAGCDAQNPFKPYTAPDESGSRQVASLAKFIHQELIEPIKTKEGQVIGFGMKPFEGTLQLDMVSRLRDVAKYFEPVGRLSQFSKRYWDLRDKLEGREPEYLDVLAKEEKKPAKKKA